MGFWVEVVNGRKQGAGENPDFPGSHFSRRSCEWLHFSSQVAISARGITPPAGILEFWLFLGSGNGPGCLVLHAAVAVGVGLPD